jgi:hypothetical protein
MYTVIQKYKKLGRVQEISCSMGTCISSQFELPSMVPSDNGLCGDHCIVGLEPA